MKRLRNFSDYFHQVVSTIDKSGIVMDRSSLSHTYVDRRSGVVKAPRVIRGERPGLVFRDGSTMNFWEKVRIEADGTITKIAYVYHYERPDGFFFRYEKLEEPHPDPFFEPRLHLHVREEEPRFPTHCTNLEELLGLVGAYFFRPT